MSETYRVAIKESVFRETPLTEDDFDDDLHLEFPSEDEAQEWVSEINRALPVTGRLVVHTAHPDDTSDADAYLVFKPTQGVWVFESET